MRSITMREGRGQAGGKRRSTLVRLHRPNELEFYLFMLNYLVFSYVLGEINLIIMLSLLEPQCISPSALGTKESLAEVKGEV